MLFFTADTHFGETRGLAIDKRPFASVKAQDEALVAHWNAVVGPADTVWHLGDFGRQPTPAVEALLQRLHGEKHLIIGNNDPEPTLVARGWASIGHYRELLVEKSGEHWALAESGLRAPGERKLLILGHYALRSWNQMGKGAINLHGHSHGRLKPLTRQIDVGVDAQNFAPIGLDAVMARVRRGPR